MQKLLLAVAFFATLSCKSRPEDQNTALSAVKEKKLADRLLANIESGAIPDFENFIDVALPESMFAQTNYVLYGTSNSNEACVKDIVPGFPRVVMIDPKENILIAYPGNKKGRCFGVVEMIDLNKTPYQFTLIDFREGHKRVTRDHGDCAECHSTRINNFQRNIPEKDQPVVNVPIWKVGIIASENVRGLWHLEALAGKAGTISTAKEAKLLKDFLAHKNDFPYKRLKGSYQPMVGTTSVLAGAFSPALKVPFGAAFDTFDNYFVQGATARKKLFKASHLDQETIGITAP